MSEYLRELRICELEGVLPFLPKAGRVLEIGGGNGWQAKRLSEMGYMVLAIDVEDPRYARERVFDVRTYDGRSIPFPDGEFDIILSSHVMEHIPHVEPFQQEIRRVCREGGTIVHIMPSGTWRFWTNLTHYARGLLVLGRLLGARWCGGTLDPARGGIEAAIARTRGVTFIRKALLPPRHGETGNCLSEIFLFSQRRWLALFRRSGFGEVGSRPLGLFYTGYELAGGRLGFARRRCIARVLGSSSIAYVMRATQSPAGAVSHETQT